MGISLVTIVGLFVAAWAMLTLIGSERQRELTNCRRQLKEEAEKADANPNASTSSTGLGPTPIPGAPSLVPPPAPATAAAKPPPGKIQSLRMPAPAAAKKR